MSDDVPSPGSTGIRQWFKRVLRSLGSKPAGRDEIIELIKDAGEREIFDKDAQEMLEGVLEVSEGQVRDVIIPRSQMVVVERDAPPEGILPVIIESGHSRFPVIGDDKDEVVGILLAKDLLRFFIEGDRKNFDIRECLRPAVFVPESKRLNVLLAEFRANRNHMAVVVDEYGGVAGLVTIEDLLEEIVGEIDDEHDVAEDESIVREDDGSYTVRALTHIDDFNDFFETNLDDEEFDTIGGLVVHEFGRLPRRGEHIRIGEFDFKVLRADKRRVVTLQLNLPDADARSAAER